MDAVISIGGQSFLDAILRILGPALQPLRAPIPIAIPGLSNGLLSIRTIRPVFPSTTPERLELEVKLDLKGELLLAANVAGLDLAGSITLPAKTNALTLKFPGGSATSKVTANAPASLTVIYDLVGNAFIDLSEIAGTIRIPPADAPALPLPAVVPVAVNLSPLVAKIILTPAIRGAVPPTPGIRDTQLKTEVDIDASTGYGVEFGFGDPAVTLSVLDANYLAGLQTAITDAIKTVKDQVLRVKPPLTITILQPAHDVPRVATDVANAIPNLVESTLANAFKGLRARTGRLIYPMPGTGASCDVRALPQVARARLTGSLDGSLVLQVAFDRTGFTPSDQFPTFVPSGLLDTRVELNNGFVLALLICLIEKFPNLSLPPGGPTITNAPPAPLTAAWSPVTLTVGPLALTGSLLLAITGVPAGPGRPLVGKAISLTFVLSQTISAPLVPGPAFEIGLAFTLPIAFDLSKLASITSLRLSGVVAPTGFTFGLGFGLGAMFVAAGASFLLFAPSFPFATPALVGIGALVAVGPHIITAIIGDLLRNTLNQVLNGLQLLESPVALPPGILEAFGTLVPTTMVVDDLVADCVLNTPTLPWSVLPIAPDAPVPPPIERPTIRGGPVPSSGSTGDELSATHRARHSSQ